MDLFDQKWAEKKRALAALPKQRQQQAEGVLSGRPSGPSPKPIGGLSALVAPQGPAKHKHTKHRKSKRESEASGVGERPLRVAELETASTIPDMVSNDEGSADESVASPGLPNSPTPRVSDIPASLAKKFGVLGDLRIPAGPRAAGVDSGSPSGIRETVSLTKISGTRDQDYSDMMKKARDQRGRMPHERDVSPRRARVNSASSSTRRTAAYAITPQPDTRYTDDGDVVLQPQSALLPDTGAMAMSEAEGDSEFNEPETDPAGNNGGHPVTGRRIGRIRVAVRKRPMREGESGEDCVEVSPPTVHIGAIKQRIDLSEYTENHDYQFDDSFGEHATNEAVYLSCGKSLIDTVFDGGSASCFAYGQTGSGKTHTMIGNDREPGLYIMAATTIFERIQPEHHVFVSLYEIYCNSLFDLLNYRTVVVAREDANKKVNICGLTWHEIASVDDLRDIIDRGTVQRRTGSTSANEFSSRSHAVLTISLRDEIHPRFCGSLNIVDLAGSERAADTAANDKQTRLEGAEINKSLLALKECIRGLDERKRHIPFRGSKLTEVLRDSFMGNSRTVMVATISPSTDSVEHTLNTLRYAFRVKGLTVAQLDPSKERNAPRPVALPPLRTKSVDPAPAPLLPPIHKRKKRSRDKKRRDPSSTGDRSGLSTPRLPLEHITAVEKGLKSEIQGLREEMTRIAEEKDRNITLLVEQNKRMEREMRKMRALLMHAQNVELADVDSADDFASS